MQLKMLPEVASAARTETNFLPLLTFQLGFWIPRGNDGLSIFKTIASVSNLC